MDKKTKSEELIIAYKELAFQIEEKGKRAAELVIANVELAFQNVEKESRAAELTVANKELAFQNEEKGKRAAELTIANKELAFQNEEKGKRAAELTVANQELAFQNEEKGKRAAELTIANQELAFQNEEKGKRAAELTIANKELAFQNEEKGKRAAELTRANKELVFQNEEREKRAAELIRQEEHSGHLAAIVESSDDSIISKSLDGIIKSWNKGGEKMFGYTAGQAIGQHISLIIPSEYIKEEKAIMERLRNNEAIDHYETVRKKKNGEEFYVSLTVSPLKDRTGNIVGISKITRDITLRKNVETELIRANKELAFQNKEKESRAAELTVANKELAFQNDEKEKRAAELTVANKELEFQNDEKEKRAAELVVANKELAFQNTEKERRAAELIVANKELAFQNDEKENRAAELTIANKELAFQNDEKEKRAAELVIANKELAFQNTEKGNRAAELIVANNELAFQNEEKEKRAAELIIANKGLAQFAYVASHDLQEPLRTIANYMQVFKEDYSAVLNDKAQGYLQAVNSSIQRMSLLIKSLLDFSRLDHNKKLTQVDCKKVTDEVVADLAALINTSGAVIEITNMPQLNGYENEMRQLFQNLVTNAIKFRKKNTPPKIKINAEKIIEAWKFSVSDNGIGISPAHFERVFEIFQRLHTTREYEGSGIGLANCKKIVQLHHGDIWIESTLGHGTTFYFTISNLNI